MATHDIFMPALSSTMTEGKIVEWLKKPGEPVSRGESVLVVESDKADMDVESFQDGFLAAVLMPDGSTAPVGETIGLIVETEAEIAGVQGGLPSKPKDSSPKVESTSDEIKKPVVQKDSLAENVSKESNLSKINSEKVSSSFASKTTYQDSGRVVASPRAKKVAAQLGVNLSTVRGTGPHGRIQAEDVKKAGGQPVSIPWIAESNAPVSSFSSLAKPSTQKDIVSSKESVSKNLIGGKSFGKPGETVSFNTLQNAVNRNMEESLSTPCFRVGYTIGTDLLDDFYKKIKPDGVTMTALLVKLVGITLAKHPQVNVAYSAGGMKYPGQVNVAVAVAMEDGGLITPVLENADKMDLYELSNRWADLVKRSRSKQLQPNEYSDGTFTLSNLGMFGVDRFDAILPPGTGGILAIAASQPHVVAGKDGSIAVKRQMQVNLTADHRVIYGADGAEFLRDLAYLIETSVETVLN